MQRQDHDWATLSVVHYRSTTGVTGVTLTATDSIGQQASVAFNVRVLSFTQDSDGDGINDASEFQMVTLGFDWQVSQPALVKTLFTNANGVGLFTPAQVQSLNVGVPLLTKSATTGKFKLTLSLQKTTDFALPFAEFPFTAPDTTVNGEGKVEFEFTLPGNEAFFRLQAQ